MTNIQNLFFDVDDTLYPSSSGLWGAIAERINSFMIERLDIPEGKVSRIRDHYLRSFGTTLNGLIADYNVDPFEYLEYVHDIPHHEYLRADRKLQGIFSKIRQQKIIFTNASADHARRVLHNLGIETCVDQIIDIVALEFINKPQPQAYWRALELSHADDPAACLFLDDRIDNLLPAGEIGIQTALVGHKTKPPQVDYHLQQITDLLQAIPQLRSSEEVDRHGLG